MIAQHLLVLQAAQKFQLAELFRLKSASRFQLSPKRQKMRRQHGFEDRKLLYQHASDFGASPQQSRCLIHLVVRFRIRSRPSQMRHHRIQIVQQFLEPQLVRLVHDDEQQLIVVLRRRLRMLQLQQFRHLEIGTVGELSGLVVGGDEPAAAPDFSSPSCASAFSSRNRIAFPLSSFALVCCGKLLCRMSEPTRSSPSGKG